MPLDSAQLEALAGVVRHGSFERAARALYVTPSAVSQRIARLEDRLGQVLIRRGQPCIATSAGRRLVRHAESVALLEHAALVQLGSGLDDSVPPVVRVAVNADSLATWFLQALMKVADLRVDVVVDNEDRCADWLRHGEVMAAVSADDTAIAGCERQSLGALRYRATAAPAFMKRWFADGVTAATLGRAPAMSFNPQDHLQARWAAAHVADVAPSIGYRLPSANAFVDGAAAGIAWGMNPEPLVAPLLADGRLLELIDDTPLDVFLFWQHTRQLTPVLQPLTRAVSDAAARQLKRVS